jgi:hypothetical protein
MKQTLILSTGFIVFGNTYSAIWNKFHSYCTSGVLSQSSIPFFNKFFHNNAKQKSTSLHAVSLENPLSNLDSTPSEWLQENYRRPAHWVFKVGNLKESLEWFKSNFNLSIFRHEEFSSGCEATCNGPYGGKWSKTMIGLKNSPKKKELKDNSNTGIKECKTFVLELTFNYGIDHYSRGDDFRYIAIDRSAFVGHKNEIIVDIFGREFVSSPDGWLFQLLPPLAPPSSPLSFLLSSPLLHSSPPPPSLPPSLPSSLLPFSIPLPPLSQ